MKSKKLLKGQEGFTLIEIIAVLIIIGILAAVAVPKYFELTTNAEEAAIDAAGAEVQARLNQHFAKQLLSKNGDCSEALDALNIGALELTTLGDFSGEITTLNNTSGAQTTLNLTNNRTSYPGSYTLTTPACQ